MPLPDNLSPTEHLQDVILRVMNAEVREEFSDLGGDDWEPDIGTSRGSLRYACTHQENDTIEMTLARQFLFYFTLRKARDLQQPVYGWPIEHLQSEVLFEPQIFLFFSQSYIDTVDGKRPVPGEVKFRVIRPESDPVTKADLTTFANRIKSAFGGNTPYKWKKGKMLVTYVDKPKGYRLKVLSESQSEAKEMITKILSIQQHTPDWSKSNISNNQEPLEAYPDNPGTHQVLGKTYKKPTRRPKVSVSLQYALAHIHGIAHPFCLYDRTQAFSNPLVQ